MEKDMMLGGFTDPRDADETIQQKCDIVKPAVEKMTGKNYAIFTAVQYRSQVVNGINYLIKVDVGCEYLHILVHEALPCYGGAITLKNVQEKKKKEDPLEPF